LYAPIRSQDNNAHKLPMYLLILLGLLMAYDVAGGDYSSTDVFDVLELLIFIGLISILKLPASREWFAQGRSKN